VFRQSFGRPLKSIDRRHDMVSRAYYYKLRERKNAIIFLLIYLSKVTPTRHSSSILYYKFIAKMIIRKKHNIEIN